MSFNLADSDRRITNLIRIGVVTAVDANAAKAVVDFGDFSSPPLPVGQLGAGIIQFWWMPSVGEQVIVASEGGEIENGIIVASIYAGNAPSRDAQTPQINLNGGHMRINGSISVTGNVDVDGDVTASGISLTQHTHPESIGSNTGAPS